MSNARQLCKCCSGNNQSEGSSPLVVSRWFILSSQVVSLPFQSVIQEVANFCAAMDTLIDQDAGGYDLEILVGHV